MQAASEVDASELPVPAPQTRQLSAEADPEEGLYRPVGQEVQARSEREELYLPSGQKSQLDEDVGPKPAGHIAMSAIVTDVSVRLPPSQCIFQTLVPDGGKLDEESIRPCTLHAPSPVATNMRRDYAREER